MLWLSGRSGGGEGAASPRLESCVSVNVMGNVVVFDRGGEYAPTGEARRSEAGEASARDQSDDASIGQLLNPRYRMYCVVGNRLGKCKYFQVYVDRDVGSGVHSNVGAKGRRLKSQSRRRLTQNGIETLWGMTSNGIHCRCNSFFAVACSHCILSTLCLRPMCRLNALPPHRPRSPEP
jgi:hypothetical protein